MEPSRISPALPVFTGQAESSEKYSEISKRNYLKFIVGVQVFQVI